MQLVTELHYNPCLLFFQRAFAAEELIFETQEHYQKQSYRNRCHILSAQGVVPLSIPVKNGNKKIKISDIEIDYGQRWLDVHWRTIQSAYGSAPFFEYYGDYVWDVYERRPEKLFQLNLDLFNLFSKLLKLNKSVRHTETYLQEYDAPVWDGRNEIHPKKEPDNLRLLPYQQVFGKQFVPNLSILDLLFNLGPEAASYLQNPKDIR